MNRVHIQISDGALMVSIGQDLGIWRVVKSGEKGCSDADLLARAKTLVLRAFDEIEKPTK